MKNLAAIIHVDRRHAKWDRESWDINVGGAVLGNMFSANRLQVSLAIAGADP